MEFFATSNGIPVHISDSNSGSKVVFLLHGYLETLYIFSEFTDLLLKQGYRVISIDLPGHGLTGSNQTINTMQFCSDTAYNVLKNICKVDSAIVIGHSLGGYIAQLMAINHPEIVNKLILISSLFASDSEAKKIIRKREISAILNSKLLILASFSIPNMYSKVNLRRLDSKIEETVEICETHDPNGISATILGMIEREDISFALKSFNSPVDLIFGADDSYFSCEDLNFIKNFYSNASVYIIPNAAHNVFIEQPQEVVSLLTIENC